MGISTFHAGDRILSRGRPWRVVEARSLGEGRSSVGLEALDGESPLSLTLLAPPDSIELIEASGLELQPRAFESFAAWSSALRILAAGLVRETGLLSGARFGRVALEAYQLAPVLRLLAKPRPSLLIADDVGLGKTIEAGLILLELMARGRARRVLVVAPPGLLDQWRDELHERFALDFTVLDNAAGVAREQTNLPAGVNPWDAVPKVLTSIDFLKRETVRNRALRKRWDLVIVDEAHALAESGTPANPYRTQRHRLGQQLRDNTRGLVLLTATPHNGYRHSYRSLLELVDPTLATFEGDRKDVERRIEQARIRRMKRQLKRRETDGREVAVFPERQVTGIPVRGLTEGERELLAEVARYCAGTARAARGTEDEDLVTFAMQIVKKRALSSRRALATTIRRRLEALQRESAREAPPERAELRDLQAGLPQSEAAAERIAERVLRSAIPADERRRKSEIKTLKAIRKKLEALPARDPKLEEVVAEIRRVLAEDPDEKLIVFTEYLDTLDALQERFEADAELRGRSVVFRGGLTRKQRGARQRSFEESGARVLLATDAASEGLNLQRHCRRILHVELPWNPNRLEQRNGRVDRYGQTRTPEIRYFFYPDSPEERVLDQLMGKLEEMQGDQISTPDVLGVWLGDGALERELTDLGAEGSNVAERMAQLVRTFEDRTAEFIRDVQPFVAAGGTDAAEMRELTSLLGHAEPLPTDGSALERAVREAIGPRAISQGPEPGTLRIDVPPAFRGAGVRPTYPAATFDRGVATRFKVEEVELITPLHPLVETLLVDARRRFLQVYPDRRGLAPRRLAARRVALGEPASILFTFLVRLTGGGDLVEEHLLALRVGTDGRRLGDPLDNLRLLDCGDPGEVGPQVVLDQLGSAFEPAMSIARKEAAAWAGQRGEALRDHRLQQAGQLRRELETDLADRLREIDQEERRARSVVDEGGQQRLFEARDPRISFDARRKSAQTQADERRREIDAYERIDDPAEPRLLGALFLVPEASVIYRHFRNFQGFFSDYYLGSVFGRESGRGRKKKLSDKTTELVASRFRRLYERAAGKSLAAPDCRERFVRPLLRDVFDFLLGEGEDRIFPLRPVGEDAGSSGPPVALVWIGAFDEDLDAGRRAPRRQLEAALSRQGLRYGFLATGERLRLVRAPGEGPPGAYLEVDLAGLAEEPEPESFALALKLLSAASFLPGTSGELPLEEYERESRKHAEKVSEDLKRAVFDSAESLVRGLLADAVARGTLADPAALSPEELGRFREAALLALYRLLFILYAEARDSRLQEHRIYYQSYSATGLCEEILADLHRAWPENRSSLWMRCLALFEIYDRGLPPIDPWRNIPPRGGDFFRRDTPEGALLANALLSDAAVAGLILNLATTAPRRGVGRERISFRELDIESLGSVYEGLLEYEPRVANGPVLEIRVQGRLFALSPEETARLCTAKNLSLQGPIEWVAGTPAERFHPEGEVEDEELEEEEDEEEEDEEEETEGGDSEDAEKGFKKGGSARLVRRLERGDFHFVLGPGRKGSGSFYTPRLLVQDLVCHALGPVAAGRSAAEIEKLRVLDPACGSGHFLVEAMRYLGMELHRAYVREHGGKAPPTFESTTGQGWDAGCDVPDEDARAAASEARAWCKRRIAERCLFGVDLNPTAVTLAHVALWIESAAGDRPLTYFEHHVRLGNSLLGSWRDHLDAPPVTKSDQRQTDVFAARLRQDFRAAMVGLEGLLAEARRSRLLIDQASPEDLAREGIQPESLEEQAFKERLRRETEKALAGARLLFDLRSASLFVPEIWRDWRGLVHLIGQPQALETEARGHSWWPAFEKLRERYRFFHWELEFPEIFLTAERPGFDAVLGNPPWDEVRPKKIEFFSVHDILIRGLRGKELDDRISEQERAHPELNERFELYADHLERIRAFLRNTSDFPQSEAVSHLSRVDLSKFFVDRAVRLVAEGGAVGMIVPSILYNGDACVGLRRYLLTRARIERFYAFENRRRLFPIDSRYKFVNLVFRNGAPSESFVAAFMRHDPEELTAVGEKPWLVRLAREEIQRYSPSTLAFLEYRNPRDHQIVAKMHAGRPTLGSPPTVEGSWNARLFDYLAHSGLYNTTWDRDLWTDPATGKLYTPQFVLGNEPSTPGETLERMRFAGFWPVFEGKHIDQFLIGIKPIRWWLSVEAAEGKYGKKPRSERTLVFRLIASNTNERTVVAVVLDEQSVAAHSLAGVLPQSVSTLAAASILNGFCFDWLVRMRMASNLSFTYLYSVAVPAAGVVEMLPKMPALTVWEGGISNITDRTDLWPRLWDINRAVAEAYGLNAEDFEHILGAFPVMARKRKAFFAYLQERLEEWKREG